jgi:D-lactate dehydrogenase
MNIVVFEAEEWEAAACARLTPVHEVTCIQTPLRPKGLEAFARAEAISPFVQSDLSRAILERLPRLKLIATRSTGYDHVDLDFCRAAGIMVCNVPDYGDNTVAEHTFALLLALCRHIPEASERTKRGDFSEAGLRGVELAGKTLGVIGAGRIGRRVIQIGRGVGMAVLAFDKEPDATAAQTQGFRYAPLGELLDTSDVVTLHVPGGGALISEAELARMKPGALLINTARGGVVDSAALVRALISGRIGGAALDVLAEERVLRDEAEVFRSGAVLGAERLQTLLADHALLRLQNVLVTPHIAYSTREAMRRIIDTTLDNIEAYANGRPQNLVGGAATTAA